MSVTVLCAWTVAAVKRTTANITVRITKCFISLSFTP
jgi:hypothetical protein